jgi:hypothetical protein
MYVAHIGPASNQRFTRRADAVTYAAYYGCGPAFVELNIEKKRYRANPVATGLVITKSGSVRLSHT